MMIKKKFLALFLVLCTLLALFAGCGKQDDKTPGGSSGEDAASYDGKLVFDHKMELKYATRFSVDYYKGGYKLAKIGDDTTLLIVPEGMSVPAEAPEGAMILQQPVTNILVSSAPTTALINAIGALDAITMTTSDTNSWYIQNVKDALASGAMTYIGSYKTPDYEQITAADVKFAIFSSMLTEDVEAQLQQLGVQILLDRAAEEAHPLARVEWMKLYGAIFNKESEADALVQQQAALVEDLAKLEQSGKTVAIFYITSDGTLYARNAGDYLTKMVELAGGSYVMPDMSSDKAGSTKLDPEAFYTSAKDADYILYIWSNGGKPATVEELLTRSAVLSDMKAVQEGNVWCTSADFFQITNQLGDMIGDLHNMLSADASVDQFDHLFRLK